MEKKVEVKGKKDEERMWLLVGEWHRKKKDDRMEMENDERQWRDEVLLKWKHVQMEKKDEVLKS